MSNQKAVVSESERLRLRGNDAVGTAHWERAAALYTQSIQAATPTEPRLALAKTYSNLAHVHCKLSRYDEAAAAAERCTAMDCTWAKGWWRRGVVAELKQRTTALRYYQMAVNLQPKERSFRQALAECEGRFGVDQTQKGPNGLKVINLPNKGAAGSGPNIMQAWKRLLDTTGRDLPAYFDLAEQRQKCPTSEQFLLLGLSEWAMGMGGAVALLSNTLFGQQIREQLQWLALQGYSAEEMQEAKIALEGGVHDRGNEHQQLVVAMAHLAGIHVPIRMGPPQSEEEKELEFWEQPEHFRNLPTYQIVAMLFTVACEYLYLTGKLFPKDHAVMSPGVLEACNTFSANMKMFASVSFPDKASGKQGSPRDVLEYCEEKLDQGMTWNGGMRRFVALQYRGTIIYAYVLRSFAQVAESYKYEKWAHEFIDLADHQWRVSKQGDFGEKGVCFRPSFRVGMMVSELRTLNVLGGQGQSSAYPISLHLQLARQIIEFANTLTPTPGPHPIVTEMYKVAQQRKPLALAYATIASIFNLIANSKNSKMRRDLDTYALQVGLRKDKDGKPLFAVAAESYHKAAQKELPDDENGAIYWWGYAATMIRTGPWATGQFTLGNLRDAIRMAERAEEARDVGIWGVNPQTEDASFQKQAKLVANYFYEEPDSFVLPKMDIKSTGTKISLVSGEAEIAADISASIAFDAKLSSESQQMDASDVESKYGSVPAEGVPTLQTLCVRELHKQECEYAIGETDPAIIHYKALKAEGIIG